MATYYNLASLSGLAVGDVVEYNTDTAVDFTGIKSATIEIWGSKGSYTTSYSTWDATHCGNGGKVQFDLNTTNLSSKIFKFFNSRTFESQDQPSDFSNYQNTQYGRFNRCDLSYGTSASMYYRIAVAGNGGCNGRDGSTYHNGGAGGGLSGAVSSTSQTAASQTAAGTHNNSGSSNRNGQFGAGSRRDTTDSSEYGGTGGYGWYGGAGGGCYTWGYDSDDGGGGGSGFIIGQSTIVYPTGYLGNDSSLISVLEAAISNATLIQGGSTETAGKMVITILELEPTSYPTIKYYDGSNFVECEVYQAIDNGRGLVSYNSIFTEGQHYDNHIGEFDIGNWDADWYFDYTNFIGDGDYYSNDLIITFPSDVSNPVFKAGILYIIPVRETYDYRDIRVHLASNQVSLSYAENNYSNIPEKIQNFFQTAQEYTECYYFTPTSDLSSLIVYIEATYDGNEYDSEATVTIRKDIYFYDEDINFVQVQPYYYNGTEFVELGI